MALLKVLKRLFWDVPLVLTEFLRDKCVAVEYETLSGRDLYDLGLHLPQKPLTPENVSILEQAYIRLMSRQTVPTKGQQTGRIWVHGLIDETLSDIVEGMRVIASDYLRVERAHLELTYFQQSKPTENAEHIPGGAFHIDDNKSNVKFFVYLSDVGESEGPFVVVPGTHRWKDPGRILRALDWALSKRRNALYWMGDPAPLDEKAKRLLGPKGSCFIVDTTAYHKADPVKEGVRRVFVASFNR